MGGTRGEYFAPVCWFSALVLADPLHKMYGKINKYLNKGPKWDWRKIPSYWIDRVLLREPEHDDGYHVEVDWLLDLLVSGLRMGLVSSGVITRSSLSE